MNTDNNYYLSLLPKNNPEPVFIFNQHGEKVFQNSASKEILPSIISLKSICSLLNNECSNIISSNKHFHRQYIEGDKTYLLSIKGSKEDNIVFAYGFNITELLNSQTKLKQKINTDELTGVFNRLKLIEDLEINKNTNTLIIVDINNFAQINSFYGYKNGDEYIKLFANELKLFIDREKIDGTLYRLQGDIFAIYYNCFCNENSLTPIIEITEKMQSLFHEKELTSNQISVDIKITIGVALKTKDLNLPIVTLAEAALLEAKKSKSPYVIYNQLENIQDKYQQNILWSQRLKKALHNDKEIKIFPFFQPIYNIKNNKIEKFEALARMSVKDEIVAPYKFLDSASQMGVLHEITKIILSSSAKVFQNSNYEFSVNISSQDLAISRVDLELLRILKSFKIKPENVVLEILEDEEMYEYIDFINDIKECGFKIAIDDFGVGYSNFKKLQQLKADYIKIDGSLIKDLNINTADRSILNSIIQYAKTVNAKTIAEFVHSKEILDILIESGVDYAQGYYIGTPAPTIDVKFCV